MADRREGGDQVGLEHTTEDLQGLGRRISLAQLAGIAPSGHRDNVLQPSQTPEWLERSFVLPLTQPEASDVPSQPVRRHDDDPDPEPQARTIPAPDVGTQPPSTPQMNFVRPPVEHIDFARVIRRSDLCRTVTRVHWVATGLAGLALLAFLLTSSQVALGVVVAFAAVAVVAFGVRIQLNRAPVPRVER